jgi:hypothetical protein
METNNCNRKIMPVTEDIRGHARMNLDKMTQQSLTLSWMRMLMMGISVMNSVVNGQVLSSLLLKLAKGMLLS